MLVHGRPFTEVLVTPYQITPTAHTNPSLIRGRGDGPCSIAEVPSCQVSSARPCRRHDRTSPPGHRPWDAVLG
jgi:hypothetical protein